MLLDSYIRLLVQAKYLVDNKKGQRALQLCLRFPRIPEFHGRFFLWTDKEKNTSFNCDLLDEAGGIAAVTTILAINQISIKNIGITHNREFEEGALRIEFYEEQAGILARKVLKDHGYNHSYPQLKRVYLDRRKLRYAVPEKQYVLCAEKSPCRAINPFPTAPSCSVPFQREPQKSQTFYRVPTVSPPSPASAVWALRSRTRRSASSFMEKACTGFRLHPPFSTAETADNDTPDLRHSCGQNFSSTLTR